MKPHIDGAAYRAMYERSVQDPEAFWAEQAHAYLDWSKPWDRVLDHDYTRGHIRWFEGAELNACVNCVDRHLAARGDQVAITWEPDAPDGTVRHVTYKQLHKLVCEFANVLRLFTALDP